MQARTQAHAHIYTQNELNELNVEDILIPHVWSFIHIHMVKAHAHTKYLKKCVAEVILEQNTANTPDVTGLTPTQLCTQTHIYM